MYLRVSRITSVSHYSLPSNKKRKEILASSTCLCVISCKKCLNRCCVVFEGKDVRTRPITWCHTQILILEGLKFKEIINSTRICSCVGFFLQWRVLKPKGAQSEEFLEIQVHITINTHVWNLQTSHKPAACLITPFSAFVPPRVANTPPFCHQAHHNGKCYGSRQKNSVEVTRITTYLQQLINWTHTQERFAYSRLQGLLHYDSASELN